MNNTEYVNSLAPVFERKEILNSLNDVSVELSDHTMPVSVSMLELFSKHAFKSRYGIALEKEIRRNIDSRDSIVKVLHMALTRMQSNLDYIEKEVKRLFANQVVSSKLTYNRVTVMRYIESMAFFLRYYRKMVLRITAEEGKQANKDVTPMTWSKAEIDWIDGGAPEFAKALRNMLLTNNELKAKFDAAAAVEVNPETNEIAEQTYGKNGLDPMMLSGRSGFLTPHSNPFFTFGKWLAEFKIKRYQAAKEELSACQLRLQEWRELVEEGNTSPVLQKSIKHTESRVEKLDYSISKIEEENRLD